MGRVHHLQGDGHEAEPVHGRADHRDTAGAGGRSEDGRRVPQTRGQQRNVYKWKTKYGGLDVSEAKRLKSLEDENAKLKTIVRRGPGEARLGKHWGANAENPGRYFAPGVPELIAHFRQANRAMFIGGWGIRKRSALRRTAGVSGDGRGAERLA
jgi:hypothetical protein